MTNRGRDRVGPSRGVLGKKMPDTSRPPPLWEGERRRARPSDAFAHEPPPTGPTTTQGVRDLDALARAPRVRPLDENLKKSLRSALAAASAAALAAQPDATPADILQAALASLKSA